MPFKFHEAQRHHILKARYRVHNWPDDDCGLVRRGDIRVWLPEDAIGGLRAVCRTTPGGQGRFSNLAIETTLILGAALRLPLRQTEGFMRSLMEVMKLEFAVPDHTTLARRQRTVDVKDDRWPRKGPIDILIDRTGLKVFGAGEWARRGEPNGETRHCQLADRQDALSCHQPDSHAPKPQSKNLRFHGWRGVRLSHSIIPQPAT
jgi:hypothetical protein